MTITRLGHTPGRGPSTSCRIVDFSTGDVAAVISPTRYEYGPTRQQRGGWKGTRRGHTSRDGPSTRRGIIDFGARQGDTVIVYPSRNEYGPVGKQRSGMTLARH